MMDLTRIKEDMQRVLDIGVDDKVKRMIAPLSKDDGVKCMALIRRICGQFKLYCNLFEAKTFKHPEGKPLRADEDAGRPVRIRLATEDNKTYFGIYIGDIAMSSSVSIKEDSIVCGWSFYNPAILVPELKKVVYGCESWWGFLKEGEEVEQITDTDISSLWYVKAFNEANKAG